MDVTVARTTGTYEALFLEYPLDFLVGGSLVHAEDLVRGLLGHGLDLLLGLLRPQGRHGRGREQARIGVTARDIRRRHTDSDSRAHA